MIRKRSRKEMKQDAKLHFEGLAAETPDPKVRERLNRPPWQAVRLLREQGRQMEGKGNMTKIEKRKPDEEYIDRFK